jgi:hypothetical protein
MFYFLLAEQSDAGILLIVPDHLHAIIDFYHQAKVHRRREEAQINETCNRENKR